MTWRDHHGKPVQVVHGVIHFSIAIHAISLLADLPPRWVQQPRIRCRRHRRCHHTIIVIERWFEISTWDRSGAKMDMELVTRASLSSLQTDDGRIISPNSFDEWTWSGLRVSNWLIICFNWWTLRKWTQYICVCVYEDKFQCALIYFIFFIPYTPSICYLPYQFVIYLSITTYWLNITFICYN